MAGIPGFKPHPATIPGANLTAIDAAKMTPYQLTRRVGWQTYRHTGIAYIPELFISGFLRSLPDAEGKSRAFYDDNNRVNLRRHVLLMGDKDTKKGSSIEVWRRIFNVAHYSETETDGRLIEMTVQSRTSWESMVGGAQDGRLLLPSVIGCDFVVAEEAMAMFGHNFASMMKVIDDFNGALQEGDIVNDVKNMKGTSDKVRSEFAIECDRVGVTFNQERCIMRFSFLATGFFATREPDSRQWKGMLDSGFVSRMAVADCSFDPIVEREYLDDQFGPGDEAGIAALREIVSLLRSCTFEHVNLPPHGLVNDIIRDINDEYYSLSEQTGLRLRDFKTGREQQYLYQLMTFNAVCRLLPSLKRGDVVKSIQYDEDDAAFALGHFRAYALPYIERRAKQGVSESKGDSILDESVKALRDYVKHLADEAEDGDPINYQVIGSASFYKHHCLKKHMANPTFQKRLATLEDLGHITMDRRGAHGERFYRVSDAFVERECSLETMSTYVDPRFTAYADESERNA